MDKFKNLSESDILNSRFNWGGPVAQWLPADREFFGTSPTATTLLSLPRHEMNSAVNVALNKHSTNQPTQFNSSACYTYF